MKVDYEKIYHDIETDHFWFKSRRKYITDLLKDYPKDIKILDIGSSSGILLNELVNLGFDVNNLYGIDISEVAIENCKVNGIPNAFVMDAQEITLNQKFDVIIASDCLEHLENDAKALENWNSLLKPAGDLFVFVPAFMSLWSQHDVANMHHRRYTSKELTTKLKDKGFSIQKASYWNFFLFFPIYIFRAVGRLLPRKDKEVSGDLDKPSVVNGLLYHLINFENKLLRSINFPFGISTYCIAKKV
jgi:SAM-dependent methyltransferase